MDEIIRQVTIDNPRRGSMLYQIQNKLTGYCNTYKSLYESSVTFGIRKALYAQQTQESMQSMLDDLWRENQILKRQQQKQKQEQEQQQQKQQKQRREDKQVDRRRRESIISDVSSDIGGIDDE